MPELPEVETVRRGLAPLIEGRRITKVIARRADLRWPLPVRLAERLAGRRVLRLDRRAKYLVATLDDGHAMLLHLGMSGRLTWSQGEAPPERPHDHIVLEFDDGGRVTFNDPRRFGMLDLVAAEGLATHKLLATIGPEPLGPAFDGKALAAALKDRKVSLKAALLDQKRIAGIGNIYASEALFEARLHPERLAASVTAKEAKRLAAAIQAVLERAIAAGGSTLRNYRNGTGGEGYFQHRFGVYDREGKPCPDCDCDLACTGGIRRIVQNARATFFCAERQR